MSALIECRRTVGSTQRKRLTASISGLAATPQGRVCVVCCVPGVAMTIHFVLLFNRQGKIRLSQWFDVYPQKDRARIVRDIHASVVKRGRKKCNIIEWKEYKIVYRR